MLWNTSWWITSFDPKGERTSVAPRWRRWKRAFELFVVGKGVTDNTKKRALLLHCAGMEVQYIFGTFSNIGEAKD